MSTKTTPALLPQKSMASFLNAPTTANFLKETLAEKKPEFVSNLIALCDADKNLAACEPGALMKCAMNATALNLPLNKNLGYAYVIPYNENRDIIDEKGVKRTVRVSIPQFQIGYKGLIQLAIRTGYYKYLNAVEIRKGEIERNKITGEIKITGDYPENEITGYMSYLELQSGFSASFYMSEAELEQHALRFSKMYQSDKKYDTMKSKWSDPISRPAMCKKTVLKLLLGTYGLMTTEFARAFESDSDEAESGNGIRNVEYAEVVQQDEPEQAMQGVQPENVQPENVQPENVQPKTIKI